MIHLDTHVVVWLYMAALERFPASLRERLDAEALVISPMVLLELGYLYEVGRVMQPAEVVRGELERTVGLELCTHPFGEVVAAALSESWTHDPLDRLIVAQARTAGADLATKDGTILGHYSRAVWEKA